MRIAAGGLKRGKACEGYLTRTVLARAEVAIVEYYSVRKPEMTRENTESLVGVVIGFAVA